MDNQVLDRYDTQGFNHVRAVANDDPVSQMRARDEAVADRFDQYLNDRDEFLDLIHDEWVDPDVLYTTCKALINASMLKMDNHVNTFAKSLAFTFMDALKTKAERKAL